jgi:hypothetical protein
VAQGTGGALRTAAEHQRLCELLSLALERYRRAQGQLPSLLAMDAEKSVYTDYAEDDAPHA